MSTYIDSRHPNQHDSYTDCPPLVMQFLQNSETIRGLSPRTVNGYYIDLRTFFRYMKQKRGLSPANADFESIDIRDVDTAFISSVTSADIYEYLYYVTSQRANSPATRARKLSALRSFYKYLCNKMKLVEKNPAEDVDTPALKKRLPKFLSLQESISLLQSVNSDFYERDFCIITLFLNCGMRLSELVNINASDIKDKMIRIIGKGNKERIVYLNDACLTAIDDLNEKRLAMPNLIDKDALFVSMRTGKRLSARRVQQIVTATLQAAGLDGKGYSTHKLRHTAATMMYQEGKVDMLALKEILGHEHVSTTEIYTHIGTDQLRDAADASPFAHLKIEKPASKKQSFDDLKEADDANKT